MAEEVEEKDAGSKYDNMSRKNLETIAKEVASMDDHNERFLHTMHAMRGYSSSHTLEAEHREPVIELMAGSKAEQMQGLYKGLHEAHKEKKDNLEHTVTTDWLMKFADTIMPTMGVGVEGETEHNYNHLVQFYLRENDLITEQDVGTTLRQVRALVAKGHGFEASAAIIEAIKKVKKQHELQNFMDFLLPPDHYEFRDSASKKIADNVNETLKKQHQKYEISWKLVSNDLLKMYQHYTAGDTKYIIEKASVKKGKASD
jgi:hypothetical protein